MALMFPVFLGVLGLVFDGGLTYFVQRRMQTAVDAAAHAGSFEIKRKKYSLVNGAALAGSEANGFDANNSTVTVLYPPESGPRTGDTEFVEVLISQNVPTSFMSLFQPGPTRVAARAVAGMVPDTDFCILTLDPDEADSLRVWNNTLVDIDCGVMVNSDDPRAIRIHDGACLNASWIGTAGGVEGLCASPDPDTGIDPADDPLADLPPPPFAPGVFDFDAIRLDSGTTTLSPGVYRDRLEITGNATVFFEPGIYILDGGLKIDGDARAETLPGGAMFYDTSIWTSWGPIEITGNASVDFKAPSSGPYQGILFYKDRTSPESSGAPDRVHNEAEASLEGVLYFPASKFEYSNRSNLNGKWTMIIANRLWITGEVQLVNDFSGSTVGPPPIRKAALVE